MVEYFNKNNFKRATDGNFNDYLRDKDINYGSNLVLVTGNSSFKSDIFKSDDNTNLHVKNFKLI